MSENFLYGNGKDRLLGTSSSIDLDDAETIATSKAVYELNKKIEATGKLPLGHFFLHPFPTPPDGCLVVNGNEYNRELYKDLWVDVQIKGQYKTEAEWQQIASENGGYCPWYSDGDGSTTFRTPKFAPYQKIALASGDAGKYYEAGLPDHTHTRGTMNITGSTQSFYTYGSGGNGAFSYVELYGGGVSTTSNANTGCTQAVFDASRSWTGSTSPASEANPIYDNSTTVQPESNDWIVCVVAFGAATNVGLVDVANVISAVERLQSLALLKSGGSLTGAVSEKLLSLSGTSVTLDLTSANNFTHTITDNTTFTVSADSDTTFQLGTLILNNAGSYTITWPSSFNWADNTPPTLNESGIDVITFFTIDGGIKYYAVQSITGVA